MRFGYVLYLSLSIPVLLVGALYIHTLVVMWQNSSSSLDDRGVGPLLVVALLSSLVEFVAVPVAVIRLRRYPTLRTKLNVLFILLGATPILICIFLFTMLVYGLTHMH